MTFAGRWVVRPDADHHADDDVSDTGARYGVAVDHKGRVAVYQTDLNGRYPPAMAVYDCFDDVPVQMLPDPVRRAAALTLAAEPTNATSEPTSTPGSSRPGAWFRQMLQGD